VSENPSAIVARLLEDLRALERAYSPGHHGLWSARRRADLLDGALVSLFVASDPPSGASLAALGGYGRQEQLPYSDIDVVIVHDGVAADDVAQLAERMFYPLWDAGLEVGQAVRTPKECAAIAAQRLDACTAMLNLRYLAGDPDVAARAAEEVRSSVRADPRGFAGRLAQAAHERHERYGSTGDLLEPDLKEGAGGLRDLASLGWLQVALDDGLESMTLLREREREALDAAHEFLTRVRSALQLETGKRVDRLLLEHQPAIAHTMGFRDEPRLIGEDGLMRSVFEHARHVSHVSDAVFTRFLEEADGASATAPSDAAGVLMALADAAGRSLMPSTATLDAIEVAYIADPVLWTDGVREGFLQLLRADDAGVDALETLDALGLLVRYLPAWNDVRCRPQRDPYHRSAVDTHLLSTLRDMGRLLGATEPSDDTLERQALEAVADADALRLGALLHDIGKTGEGGHAGIGARIAETTLTLMNVAPSTRDLAAFMVAQHLLLPDTATRRDLTDEGLIMDVAARIGSPERLAALYLLAKADAAATGPSAWTPWRQALICELVLRVQRVFDRGEMGTELAERLAERVGRLRDLLVDEPDDDVERFVLGMPRGYFLTVEPAQAARHFATIAPDVGANEVRTASVEGAKTGTYELLVVALDRSGLLSWIAGALALAGLSILSAHVFTTDEGVAVDLFEVAGAYESEVGEGRWREFRGLLRRAITGQVSLERRVAEKRAYYPMRSTAPVTVSTDNDASDFSTVIEIGGPDRLGLLYDITSTLAELRLDVNLAKVATYTDRVIDTFYVRDALGQKVTDPAQLLEIETAVRARLEG
jgi:[protein-PII] uridylyltransferase